MDDSQQIMNGHARMAIDNLAMSGSLVFDVDESALVGGQSMEIYPGKIFRRQAGMPGQAIHGLKFPNTSQENLMMFDKFRQLADEQTGIPSYSHGQTGVQSMTRTASGMSMLLGAASLNIKTVVKNLDDFLLKPLGESYFQWNMQFLEDVLDVKVDLEVKKIVDKGYERARKVLTDKIDDLHKLAKALLIYETLSGDEIRDLILKDIKPSRSFKDEDEEDGKAASALGSLGLKPKPAI